MIVRDAKAKDALHTPVFWCLDIRNSLILFMHKTEKTSYAHLPERTKATWINRAYRIGLFDAAISHSAASECSHPRAACFARMAGSSKPISQELLEVSPVASHSLWLEDRSRVKRLVNLNLNIPDFRLGMVFKTPTIPFWAEPLRTLVLREMCFVTNPGQPSRLSIEFAPRASRPFPQEPRRARREFSTPSLGDAQSC